MEEAAAPNAGANDEAPKAGAERDGDAPLGGDNEPIPSDAPGNSTDAADAADAADEPNAKGAAAGPGPLEEEGVSAAFRADRASGDPPAAAAGVGAAEGMSKGVGVGKFISGEGSLPPGPTLSSRSLNDSSGM